MVHPSRLVLELSPDEIHRRRRIHRSGRGTSRGWRRGEHLGVEKPAIQEIWPSRRLSTLTAPSRNRSPACPLAAIDTSRHGVLIGATTTLLGPAGPCRAGPGQLPAGRQGLQSGASSGAAAAPRVARGVQLHRAARRCIAAQTIGVVARGPLPGRRQPSGRPQPTGLAVGFRNPRGTPQSRGQTAEPIALPALEAR
jgi:hypothetical protein